MQLRYNYNWSDAGERKQICFDSAQMHEEFATSFRGTFYAADAPSVRSRRRGTQTIERWKRQWLATQTSSKLVEETEAHVFIGLLLEEANTS